MNQMFRTGDQPAVVPGDIIRTGHEDWNDRIRRAMGSELAWKRTCWGIMALLAGSVAGNVWQGSQSKVQMVHVVHDTIGNVITVQPTGAGQFKPTQAQIAAALRNWVTNVRTVYIDVNALRRSILAAFDLVGGSSQAHGQLSQFYQTNDAFKRAALETVALSNVVAIPPPDATLGKDDLQTWRVQWVETVTGRDGIVRSVTNQVVTASITVTTPNSLQEALSDPDGVHIISFAWTQQ